MKHAVTRLAGRCRRLDAELDDTGRLLRVLAPRGRWWTSGRHGLYAPYVDDAGRLDAALTLLTVLDELDLVPCPDAETCEVCQRAGRGRVLPFTR